MPKKTKDEFKQAFRAMKKPKRPAPVSGKMKGELETAIEGDDLQAFVDKLNDIKLASSENYVVDLVAYKLGKHLDDGSGKMSKWHTKVPKEILTKALAKVFPGDMADLGTQGLMHKSIADGDIDRVELLVERDGPNALDYFRAMSVNDCKELLEKAASGGSKTVTVALTERLYEADPDGTLQFFLDGAENARELRNVARDLGAKASQNAKANPKDKKLQEIADTHTRIEKEQVQRETQLTSGIGAALGPDSVKETAKYLVRIGGPKAERQLLPYLSGMQGADIIEIARSNPANFITGPLTNLETGTRAKLLADPALRDALAQDAPNEWANLVQQVPVLKLYKDVGERRARDVDSGDKKTEQLKNVQAIFDGIMDDGSVAAAYVGTRDGNPSEIMASVGPKDPNNPPRTDCHNMLMVLQTTIGGYPGMQDGLGKQLKWGHCSNMLMTKPLDQIGVTGRGTIDKTFTGNVFDESGTPTKRILFTGEGGVNSHSWLEADGQAFDPVLGISGTVADVKNASTYLTFDWAVDGKIGKSGNTYFIKHDREIIRDDKPDIRPATNPMSFNTAYWLTNNPASLLTPKALKEFGLDKLAQEEESELETSER